MNFFSVLKSLYVEQPIVDEFVWHKRLRAPWFTRTVDGKPLIAIGQIWRRKRNGKWEYRQDAETQEQWESRIW